MFQWILSLLASPVIKGILDGYKAKLAAGNTESHIAADLAGRELEVQKREIEVQSQLKVAEIGKWYEPTHLFAYIMVIYFGKVVLWDKVFASITGGSTDPIYGDGAQWAGMIFAFYLGKRGIENVARILKR